MPSAHTVSRLLLTLLLGSLLAGCGWFRSKEDPLETLPVEEMYAQATRSMDRNNFDKAERYYNRLIARFPFGPYTEQSQLNLAFTYYKQDKPEEATSVLNRFIRTYPTHQHVAYAHYLKALINFDVENAFLQRFARLDMTQRDQGNTRQSFGDFSTLLQRYPSSRYAADARQRMVYLRNMMARHELGVGLYYLRRDAWVAALNRGKYILQSYPQSMHQGDALALMGEAYRRMGEKKLSEDMRRVLELNQPDHPWLKGKWPRERWRWLRIIPLSGGN